MTRTLSNLFFLSLACSLGATAQTAAPAPAPVAYSGPQAVLYLAPMSCQGGSCGNNAGAEFEAALTQALQNSGYFRVIKREDVANLGISGGVTNIEGSSGGGFLFFAQNKTKVKAALQVSDPTSGELIFTEQCEGESTSNAVAAFGFTMGSSSGYGKAAADCAIKLSQAITASKRIQPFLKYAPGAALPAPRNASPVVATAPMAFASAPTAVPGALTPDQAAAPIKMLEGALKSLAFADVNALFTSDPYNPVKIKELNAAATTATLQNVAKMTFKVSSSENGGMGQLVGVTYTLPNGTEKFTQLLVMGPSELNSRGGVRVFYMTAFNPIRAGFPQFEMVSKNVELMLADIQQGLGLPTP
ncbi:hypothetical protein ACFFLM_25465 [Deinococcus oregonensis]|uniref:Uncharacterized protein n=1 Tax=Deinococcus oregonensis TaxID=1805970 RepID=A0ABV6B7S3_9DEIO